MTSNHYLPPGPPPSQNNHLNRYSNNNNSLPISTNPAQFPPPHLYSHNSTGSSYTRGVSSLVPTSDRRADPTKLIRANTTEAVGRRASDSRLPSTNSNFPSLHNNSGPLPGSTNSSHRSPYEQEWNQSWEQDNERRLLNIEPLDRINEVIRASEQDAENYRIRRESESAEDARIYQATLAYSIEQAQLKEARILEEEEAEEIAMRDALARSKGKARETERDRLERAEREEMEMVLALSLSETKIKREGAGETSAEAFERLSRPSHSDESSFHSPALELSQSNRPSASTIPPMVSHLESRSSSFHVVNPDLDADDEVPPPAYTIESQANQDSARHSSSLTTEYVEGAPSISVIPPTSPRSTLSRLTTTGYSTTDSDVSFYSSNDAAVSNNVMYQSSYPTPSLPDNSIMQSDEDAQDPFDENFAATDMTTEYYSDEDIDRNNSLLPSEEDSQPSTSYLDTQFLPVASTSELSPSPSHTASRGNSPLFGGLVESSSLNADPDDIVLQGIKFGFLPFSRATKHPPLEMEGSFPDVAQLSQRKGEEYNCFAIESCSWNSLLTYLMWYGNSMIEAAPSDLESTKSTLSCRMTLEFYRSFLDAKERVRIRIDLLSPKTSQLSEIPSASFDPDCPNITIRLPQTQILPFSLAILATTISTAHTLSRQSKKSVWSNNLVNSTSSNQHRVLKDLSLAIDLFRKLRGESVEDESIEDEDSLLIKLKGRLKRRKKIELLAAENGLVGGALPEAALMVTPFRLVDQ